MSMWKQIHDLTLVRKLPFPHALQAHTCEVVAGGAPNITLVVCIMITTRIYELYWLASNSDEPEDFQVMGNLYS